MIQPANTNSEPIVRKLESIFSLTAEERAALQTLPMQVTNIGAGQDIVREGDRPSRCCLVLEGFTCNFKLTTGGNRQIVNFHIGGDIPDLQSLHLRILDNSLGTISDCKVGFIQHEVLLELCKTHFRIGSALWRETLIDAAIFREWMLSIGRRDAHARIAHLLCELLVRLRAVGLAENHTCKLPITQAQIGDALGLSDVHVNRVLQSLRGDGLITLQRGVLSVLDWERLKEVGEFDATYLHLQSNAAAA
jgi:CRP-like cAMP-binding protein